MAIYGIALMGVLGAKTGTEDDVGLGQQQLGFDIDVPSFDGLDHPHVQPVVGAGIHDVSVRFGRFQKRRYALSAPAIRGVSGVEM
jgi:hypothetical protein